MTYRLSVRLLILVGLMLGTAPAVHAGVLIVENGKSTGTIVLAADAPESVKAAAAELQRDIALATGAKLPIATGNAQVAGPIISLGATPQAAAAGISAQGIADGGYRIVTRGNTLYILGPDTPDDGWTAGGGFSSGTANGVYSFLEEQLDVRWLMPGDLGRDVPPRKGLEIGQIDRTHTPLFSNRLISQLFYTGMSKQQRQAVQTWMDRQRVGSNNYAAAIEHNHNWWRTVNRSAEADPLARGSADPGTPAVKALYKEHPDWFAMDASGKRPLPKNHYAKLESTNPQLVQWFAQQAIRTLKAAKRPQTFSLSPSDGSSTWSQSPESKALYDPSPSKIFDPEAPADSPGVSSLVLKWYHDVAQIVAREYPQGRLAGYIYSTYLYPPSKFSMKLPDNFTPVIAPSISYGYGLYRPRTREVFQEVMESWAKVAPANWYYYDLPNQILRQSEGDMGTSNFPGNVGLVTPAAPDLLNFLFHTLVHNRIKGTDSIYGLKNWSSGALTNTVLARMIWNPEADARALRDDWLTRAYGAEAGQVMQQFYDKLNGWFHDYYQSHAKMRYELTRGMLKDVYGAHYAELESLYLQAQGRPMNDVQKQRLQLIGDNLAVLQWRLRNAGFLPPEVHPQLACDSRQVNQLLKQSNDGFEVFPEIFQGTVRGTDRVALRKSAAALQGVSVQLGQKAAGDQPVVRLDDHVLMLYSTVGGEIRITPEQVIHDASFATYVVYSDYSRVAYPDSKARLAEGILDPTLPVTLSVKANTPYYLYLPPRKVRYRLRIEQASLVKADQHGSALTLHGGDAPLCVYHQSSEKSLMSVTQENGYVLVENPSSGAGVRAYLKTKYKTGRIDQNLDEGWRFSPDPADDGLKRGVTKADFDDSGWATLTATNWWQMQGFADYHGPAWYRIQFDGPTLKEDESARIFFGAVDGDAIVYLNGRKVGEHRLGERFAGWDKAFALDVTRALQPGKNTLTVQVLSKSKTSASGIFKGVCLISGVRK